MKTTLSSSALLSLALTLCLPPAGLAQAPPAPGAPVHPLPQPKEAAACFLHADEVWLTSDRHGVVPAAETKGGSPVVATNSPNLYLHIKVSNQGEQTIVGYVVHADIAARSFDLHPERPGEPASPDQKVPPHRHWAGELAPSTSMTETWRLKATEESDALHRIWFDRVKFADGSVWAGDEGASCSFNPTGHIVPTHSEVK